MTVRASALAFKVIFSFIPILAIAYSVFAIFGGLEQLQKLLQKMALDYLAPSVGMQIKGYIQTLQTRIAPGALGLFGIFGFLYSAITTIIQIEDALNNIWGIGSSRSWRRQLTMYTLTVLFAPLVIAGSVYLTSYLAAFMTQEGLWISHLFIFILAVLPYVMAATMFSLLYLFIPHTFVDWRAAIVSGVLTALTFEILKYAYTFYASAALQASVYGTLAALPIFFLWVYLACLVFLLGAEFCYFLDQRRAGHFLIAKPESQLSPELLLDIVRAFSSQADSHYNIKQILAVVPWDQSVIARHMSYLMDLKLLGRRKENEYYRKFTDTTAAMSLVVTELNKIRYSPIPRESIDGRTRLLKEDSARVDGAKEMQ